MSDSGVAAAVRPEGRRSTVGRLLLGLMLLFLLPLGVSTAGHWLQPRAEHWWQADTRSSGQAPAAALTPEAVLQVYAARAFGWRGALGVHSWIAFKPAGAQHYTRLEVMGWGVRRGYPAVRRRRGDPDALWFGSHPQRLVDVRGPRARSLIAAVLRAADGYPHPDEYRLWPGPNSNTFTAYIGRQVPGLRLDLPPTAIGKDYIAGGGLLAASPSGTGVQFSLYGLAGVLVGLEEGLEVNLLGLTVGVDLFRPALKLPGLGRLGFP